MSQATSDWNAIILCSEKLQQLAMDCAWESMPEIASQRDAMIKKYFTEYPSTENNALAHKNYIQKILEIDKRILDIREKDHAELNDDLTFLKNSSKAVNAYHNCP